MGLTKSLRLARTAEFASVRANGKSFPGRFMVVSVQKADDIVGWKCGFITPKKLGIAVERNRIRRRLRELVRADTESLRKGHWRAPQATFEELKKDWRTTAKRAGLLES